MQTRKAMQPYFYNLCKTLVGCLLITIAYSSCQKSPGADDLHFSQDNPHVDQMEHLQDTTKVLASIRKLPHNSQKVDSLLIIAKRLKAYDFYTALFYADKAYTLATEESWDLQRAISLYYIALMKRRLQTWGGGIEDALADAEMSRLLFERLGRQDWLVRVYDLMGIIHFRQYERDRPMKLDTARAYFQKALTTIEFAHLNKKDSVALTAEVLHDLGTTFQLENDSIASRYFEQSYKNYLFVKNDLGLTRLQFSQAKILIKKREYIKADSLYRLIEKYAVEHKNIDILTELYVNLSDLYLIQFKKEGDLKLFSETIDLLKKRLLIQKEDKHHSYARMGYAFNGKAVVMYKKSKKFSNTDSVSHYYDLAYQNVDSTVLYYKMAIEDARSKGVLTVMDNLMLNIFNNCIDKQLEGKGDCKEILGKNTAKYLSESYKMVADLMTQNLTKANHRIREMERLESERIGGRKRRELLYISLIIFAFAGLTFLLFLQRSEKKKLKAQMEALRAQINPHFMSNSLNAIESLVNHGENAAASKYLVHFSRLTRRILNSSRNPQTSLAEELQTLKHFLELEQLRFRDKLNYEIEISNGLQPGLIEIPAMILQPYVENAIWHGIKPKDSPGMLQIKIERNGKYLVCQLEDDGIGRDKSQQLQAKSVFKHKSQGMAITEERLKVSGKVKGARVEVIDLKDTDGEAMGTRVVIKLPFKLLKKKQ